MSQMELRKVENMLFEQQQQRTLTEIESIGPRKGLATMSGNNTLISHFMASSRVSLEHSASAGFQAIGPVSSVKTRPSVI